MTSVALSALGLLALSCYSVLSTEDTSAVVIAPVFLGALFLSLLIFCLSAVLALRLSGGPIQLRSGFPMILGGIWLATVSWAVSFPWALTIGPPFYAMLAFKRRIQETVAE